MTVQEIMDTTGLKRGTIESFRARLIDYGIVGNNNQLGKREVDVLQRVVHHKQNSGWTWTDSMEREIQLEYADQIRHPFEWAGETILVHLLWLVTKKRVKVAAITGNAGSEDFHVAYEVMVDNFHYLKNKYPGYSRSTGSDANPILTYKLIGADYIYYLVGKLNHMTDHEDIHIFYCDGSTFNLMKTRHVMGCSSDRDAMKELWTTCNDLTRELKEAEEDLV